MNLLFWNTNRNGLESLIACCAREREVDLICLAEPSGLKVDVLMNALGDEYRPLNQYPLDDRLMVIASSSVLLNHRFFSGGRFVVCNVSNGNDGYNVAAVHLQDRRNSPDDEARVDALRDLVAKLSEYESLLHCDKSIVIGDFNVDPFDSVMIQPGTLFSTLFKGVALRRPVRKRAGKERALMYNPVIECLSAEEECYGSYYYDKDYSPLYWHFYDQVVVGNPLINSLEHVEYLKEIGTTSLIKANRPNECISDHLPLFVSIGGPGDDS